MDNINSVYRYYIKVSTKKNDYSDWVRQYLIKKQMTKDSFASDSIMFSYEASELTGQIYDEIYITFYYNDNGNKKEIYNQTFIIQGIESVDDPVGNFYLYMDSKYKKIWLRNSMFSQVYDNSTCKNAISSFIDKTNSVIDCNIETFFASSKNLNNNIYEKILFPTKTHFFNIVEVANRYKLYNAPFYIYFDEYNFGETYKKYEWTRIGFYDFSNQKEIRADISDSWKSNPLEYEDSMSSYIDPSIKQQYKDIVPKVIENNKFIPMKYVVKEPAQNHYAVSKYVPDTKNVYSEREENYKNYYTSTKNYFIFRFDQGDINSVNIGNRLILDTDKSDYQYTLITVEIDYNFYSSNTNEKQNEFVCDMTLICLTFNEEEVNP